MKPAIPSKANSLIIPFHRQEYVSIDSDRGTSANIENETPLFLK